MNFFKKVFTPLTELSYKTRTILVTANVLVALILWQVFAQGGLIPNPVKIVKSLIAILGRADFFDNLFSSLGLTLKVFSQRGAYRIPTTISETNEGILELTLTGLIFLFTLLTQNGHDLKISLLIFGIVPFFVTSFLSIIDAINVQEYELCKTLRMNNWQTLLEVVIIGRLDQVLEVMRQNFAIAWMMITMVEGLSMSEGGLGTMLIKSNKYIDLSTVFALLVIIFALGIFFDMLLGKLRHWFFPYTKLQLRK